MKFPWIFGICSSAFRSNQINRKQVISSFVFVYPFIFIFSFSGRSNHAEMFHLTYFRFIYLSQPLNLESRVKGWTLLTEFNEQYILFDSHEIKLNIILPLSINTIQSKYEHAIICLQSPCYSFNKLSTITQLYRL